MHGQLAWMIYCEARHSGPCCIACMGAQWRELRAEACLPKPAAARAHLQPLLCAGARTLSLCKA